MRVMWLAGLVFCLTACSSLPRFDEWSEQFPEREIFIEAYEADEANHDFQSKEEYLLWVKRFYEGFNLVPGWVGMSEQLLDRLKASQYSNVKQRLYSLGSKISREWSKDNKVRLIDSRAANVWRDALLEALDREELGDYLIILDKDVDGILSGNLAKDDIYFERYYEDEFDDF